MEIKELYDQLMDAYSNENLNKITGNLIALYKNKSYGKIRELANKISKYVEIFEEEDAKCFSKLVMLYHPDKGESIRQSIETFYIGEDFESLNKYAHILKFNVNGLGITSDVDEDIDYNPEYNWDNKQTGYRTYSQSRKNSYEERYTQESENTFYNAIKLRMYGDVTMEFPSYYLEDFEEFELADSRITSLDGVSYCIHATTMDLSNNEITDISDLWDLERLEELYLSNNQIGYIDALCNLPNLRTVDLSGNQIDDIFPLFELENLEYVNLIGNQIPMDQIAKLREKGIIVMY